MPKKYILDAETVSIKLERMAYELLENNLEESKIILAGIQVNGSVIARAMEKILQTISTFDVQLINLTLDKKNPGKVTLSENANIDNAVIVIVDDVANSGRTMLYSLKPFLEFHPKKIQTLALVARTHKAFPVELDYVGLSVATTLQEHIYVEVEGEKISGAYME
jgi:pyrimidine operon attenuation protein/uracil phosphoribosyltransferase